MAIGLEKEKLAHVKDFLQDLNDTLKIAKDNVRRAQDSTRHYADKTHCQLTFEEGNKVYLRVLEYSDSLKTTLFQNYRWDIAIHS